ncbi:uncharacterized protein LOC124821623 isoform X1 [Vigna umbellata]|uniref:uncharacterized protein LOC124821623 isoform X1 n=1 Tax=Vigna umbellata TaxID=87088 RepID=UPI001F5EA887|nr:uncharacterized protein LOC124821623 isoform X1 [Vigna umbellata]XP_047149495.1 uncharacterized protein LOC124821623 isoform X1 [Vigna umbellata]XP_047149496.1 uncharacterized protein LOC124821623 isoform X1 [Vigna umbellata]
MEEEQRVAQVEVAKQRCKCVIDAIDKLPCSTNITHSCKRTLLKLARADLSFLSRPSSSSSSGPLSVNIGHLETVVHILQQPFITGVSRVCKSIPLSPSVSSEERLDSSLKHIHVDVVCTLNRKPVWIIVSDRNPEYISWDRSRKSKGLKLRIQEVLAAAQSNLTLRPSSVILFFANGLATNIYNKLRDELGAYEIELDFSVFSSDVLEETEGDWINVIARSYRNSCVLEINPAVGKDVVPNSGCIIQGSAVDSSQIDLSVGKAETQPQQLEENARTGDYSHLELFVDEAKTQPQPIEENVGINLGDTFCSILMGMKPISMEIKKFESAKPGNLLGETDLVNFDTTALIALVSGISNGGTNKLLATPDSEMRQRFKGNFDFVIGQIMSEIQNPIHLKFGRILHGKHGLICESVLLEFKELVSMCGGPNEKLRAARLIDYLRVVPDTPSERMMGLPTTRKLALKNKVVFGTGDRWHAPTLTANMAFVRAVSQTGMSLSTIEHRPRALTGD